MVDKKIERLLLLVGFRFPLDKNKNMDEKRFRDHLSRLRVVAHHRVVQLSPELSKLFDELVMYMEAQYEDPIIYMVHFTILLEYFPKAAYKMGTVGARFVGCLLDSEHERIGCDPLCASALRLPMETSERNSYCDSTVAVGYPSRDGIVIDQLRKGFNDHVLLYLQAAQFNGLDRNEIERLATMGQHINIHLMREPLPHLSNLEPDTVPIRRRPKIHVFLFVVVVLLLVCLIYILTTSRRRPGKSAVRS